MQNCIQRDEDIRDEDTKATINVKDDLQSNLNMKSDSMKSDSIKSDEGVIDPDPPVRDGDNWRLYNKY